MNVKSLSALALLFCLQAHSQVAELQAEEPSPPEKAAAAMQVPEGFKVTLFAGEPDVKQPIAMCIDDRGRVWIAEGYSYPKHQNNPQQDRILILEDTDGDGRFDKRTVFYDKLNYVTGIEVGFGGAWVMSPPYFYFIPDRDGNDVPDREPKVVLDGFGNHANSHNLANGFAWGPDGWLYGTHGRTNWSLIGNPGTPKDERVRFDGGVWRYHPVRDTWEPFADGCTNPWGIDWNDYGQAFMPNTVDPHLFHTIQGAHYEPWRNRASSRFAYQRIKTIADHLHYVSKGNVRDAIGSPEELAAGGGHSHCGMLVYLGDNWPDRYRNSVFMHNTHGKRINNDVPERKGSGYTAHHAPDLLISSDPWFMGVSLRTGPDGTVYITDWSDTGECHSTRNTRKSTGRIFCISYGEPEVTRVNIAVLSDQELVQRQLHKNDWHVRHARRVLQERAAAGQDMGSVHRQLRAILDNNPDVTRKLRALWALWVTGGANDSFLTKLLDHGDEHLRTWAITLLCEDRSPSQKVLARFAELAKSGPSQLVRLSLASALQRLEPAKRWPIAESLLGRSEDRDDQNLPLMSWYGIEPLVHADVERFAGLVAKARSPIVRRHIARRIASLPDPQAGLVSLLVNLERAPDLDALEGILTGLKGRADLTVPANWPRVSTTLSKDPRFTGRILELGAKFGDPATFAQLRALAENDSAPEAERLRALSRLLESKPVNLSPWLHEQLERPVLQRPALRGLARFNHADTPTRILALYSKFRDLETRRDALQTLASRPAGAAALLDAIDSGVVPQSDLTAYTARQIHSLASESLNQRLAKLWGNVRTTPKEKRKRIDQYVRNLTRTLSQADLPRGRLLYQQLCASCHQLFEEGGALGPNLTGSQRSNLDYLIENIIDPSASVARAYQMQVIELANGRTVTGFISAETETTITIRTLNEELVTPRTTMKKRSALALSIMPESLLDQLDKTQVRDLVGYLASPKQVPLP